MGRVPYIKVPAGTGGEDTLVVFDNQLSYDFKIAFAESLGLAGVFYWQIGQEIKSFSSKIRNTEPPNVSKAYYLYQNYPNPFNPETTIMYALPERAWVKLTLYNLLGKKITTLVNKNQSAGYHECVWNAKDQPSGMYFYQLTAGNFTQIRKMLLLR